MRINVTTGRYRLLGDIQKVAYLNNHSIIYSCSYFAIKHIDYLIRIHVFSMSLY